MPNLRATRRARRLARTDRAANARNQQRQITCGAWPNIAAAHSAWAATCAAFITGIVCCAFCCCVALGGAHSFTTIPAPDGQQPPAVWQAAHMHDFMHDGNGHWHACPVCAAENSVREAWLVTLTPAYVRDLLSIPCAETQLLSLIDVRTDLQQKYMGFHEGELFRASLFDAPLVHLSDSMHVSPPSWPAAMVRVLVHNLLHNPLYHTYKAMCELTGAASVYPVLPYEAVGNVLRQVQHRGHLYSVAQAHHLQASNIGLAVDADPRPPASRHTPYVVANLHRRHDNGVEQLLVASDGLGYMGNDNAVTAEAALFPFLFPLARGMYRGVARLTAYVKYRMSC